MSRSNLRIIAAGLLGLSSLACGFFIWKTTKIMDAMAAPVAIPMRHLGSVYAPPAPDLPSAPIIVTFDEVVANIGPYQSNRTHMLIVKMDLELFEEGTRRLIEKRQGGVKHMILELARTQNTEELKTMSGKLYFKEQVVSKLNTYLNQPAIRDIHFSSFLLR